MEQLTVIEQPHLQRRVATYRVASPQATPTRHDLVAAIRKKEKGTVVVTHIYPVQGEHVTIVHAHLYSDEAAAARLERPNMLAKQTAPPKEAPAAAETEDASAEPAAAQTEETA